MLQQLYFKDKHFRGSCTEFFFCMRDTTFVGGDLLSFFFFFFFFFFLYFMATDHLVLQVVIWVFHMIFQISLCWGCWTTILYLFYVSCFQFERSAVGLFGFVHFFVSYGYNNVCPFCLILVALDLFVKNGENRQNFRFLANKCFVLQDVPWKFCPGCFIQKDAKVRDC